MINSQKPIQSAVKIDAVSSRADLRKFIELPWKLYADDKFWVPPLKLERRMHFSSFNSYFKNAEWQAWVAYVDNEPVGRITAQIDRVHQGIFGEHSGHFGFIEGENDPDIFQALFDTAEEWLKARGISYVSGPFNFSINQECGILVDGFDTPPCILMPHSRQWYGPIIEQLGYRQTIDLLAYWIESKNFGENAVLNKLVKRYSNKVRIRPLNKKKFDEELEIMRDIFNDAWSNNWGFIPFSKEEFAELGAGLKPFVPDGYIQISEIDNKPVSFLVILPNLNEILYQLNGKLFPFGWLKMLRAVSKHRIKSARIPLMGVKKEYQNNPIGPAMTFLMCQAARDPVVGSGIEGVEMSWILDSNKGMKSILKNLSAIDYKRYRIYEKSI
jgi:hypothetical protein